MSETDWCNCEPPKLKQGISKLHHKTKCLTCNRRIRKFFKTQSGKVLVLRIANEFHICRGCEGTIEPRQLYFAMTVSQVDDPYLESGFLFHTWALCYKCRMHAN